MPEQMGIKWEQLSVPHDSLVDSLPGPPFPSCNMRFVEDQSR
jgi:hypothetical protein